MSRAKNTIKQSDISSTPIKVKYSATYVSQSLLSYGITTNRGQNIAPSASMFSVNKTRMVNYRVMRQLYYQNYLTGSVLDSASFWDPLWQSTASSGSLDNDSRYIQTGSGLVSSSISFIAIPTIRFGEQISRNSFAIKSTDNTTYRIVDDGNGNLLDELNSSVKVGNIFYAQGIATFTNNDYIGIIGNNNFTVSTSIIPTPSPTPTPTITSTVTPTVTATPTQTPAATTSVTPTVTPTKTVTASPGSTPSVTPTRTPTTTPPASPTATPTKTPAATSTPSPAATQLFIYGKYIGGGGSKTLQYTLNGGSPIEIGSIDTTSCLIVTTLSGLSNGDAIVFSEVNTRGVAGSLTNPCPDSGFLCSYTVNIVTGANYVYLTIDSDNVC